MSTPKVMSHASTLISFLVGVAGITYVIVFFFILWKSFEFFQSLEKHPDFEDVSSIAQLKQLYRTAFIIKIIAAVLVFFFLLFWAQKMKNGLKK